MSSMIESDGSGTASAPGGSRAATAVQTADWRRRVFALYASVRRIAATDAPAAHAHWISCRNELFSSHPASPLLDEDRERFRGLPVVIVDRQYDRGGAEPDDDCTDDGDHDGSDERDLPAAGHGLTSDVSSELVIIEEACQVCLSGGRQPGSQSHLC